MNTPWEYVDYLYEQTRRIEEREFECGVSQDHDWRPGDLECRRCSADLSSWNEDEDGEVK